MQISTILLVVLGCFSPGSLAQEKLLISNQPEYPLTSASGLAFSVRKAVTDGGFTRSASPFNLQFKEILTNEGYGWEYQSGEFIAPVSGGFFFSFNAMSSKKSDFTLALMRNGIYQVTAYATEGYQMGSNSAFLVLEEGDSINLTLQQGKIYEHPNYETYTTFSGFLVYRNY